MHRCRGVIKTYIQLFWVVVAQEEKAKLLKVIFLNSSLIYKIKIAWVVQMHHCRGPNQNINPIILGLVNEKSSHPRRKWLTIFLV